MKHIHSKIEAIDEILESLWCMEEKGQDSLEDLTKSVGPFFDATIVDEMVEDGLVTLKGQGIFMTDKGKAQSRKIIRAHRIGETLLHHVFGWDFEKAACEFEHTSSTEMVNGICVLLGHPQYCPHGKAIPPGECCTKALDNAHSEIHSLLRLQVGDEAKVAYINCADNRTMHKLNGLQLRPGSVIKMNQRYPCYVIECEGAVIALDEEVGENIKVWAATKPEIEEGVVPAEKSARPAKGVYARLSDFFAKLAQK